MNGSKKIVFSLLVSSKNPDRKLSCHSQKKRNPFSERLGTRPAGENLSSVTVRGRHKRDED